MRFSLFLFCFGMITSIAFGQTAPQKIATFGQMSGEVRTLDPAKLTRLIEDNLATPAYATLLQYDYRYRPISATHIQPWLLAEMPTVSSDGLTYHLHLRDNVYFHDDPCFPNGKGRKVTVNDIVYEWKRLADKSVAQLSNWSYIDKMIVGFDDYKDKQNAKDVFDYDAEVEGLRVIDDYHLDVILTQPSRSFIYLLAMVNFTPVPKEAVKFYGDKLSRHMVGSGPFIQKGEWDSSDVRGLKLFKNPNHFEKVKDYQWPQEMKLNPETRLPLIDQLVFQFFDTPVPSGLEFNLGNLDWLNLNVDLYEHYINLRTTTLLPEWRDKNVVLKKEIPLFVGYEGFNMEDPFVGGEHKKIRQAISLAIDNEAISASFFSNTKIIYDGLVPPGLPGHPNEGNVERAYRGLDIQRAKRLLAEEGWKQNAKGELEKDGKIAPSIEFYFSSGMNGQAEMIRKQLAAIGLNVNPRIQAYVDMEESVKNGKATMFASGWGLDFPDAENILGLLYGPNRSPGCNLTRYNNPEFDELYKKLMTLPLGDERTALIEKLRDMAIEDSPIIATFSKPEFKVARGYLKNFYPSNYKSNFAMFMDIDLEQKARDMKDAKN